MLLSSIKPGDWTGVRKNFQKLGSLYLGERSAQTFAELTLTGLTASQLIQTDADKKLTSIALPLIVAKGGTGAATLTDHGILLGSGTGAITPLGAATNGQLPIGSTGADPVLAGLTGTANQITVTNAAGSITLSTPQNIHTGASPTFAGLTLTNTAIIGSNSVVFQPNADSTTFFQVLDADGGTPIFNVDTTNKKVGIGTTAPNAPLEVKGAKPAGNIGGFQSGMLHVTGTETAEFSNSVITGHSAFNGNTQLWYLGSTTINNDDIAFINRQNAPIHFYTNNTSRMTIDAAGNVTLAIIAAEGSDVDKFLVSSSGVVKYRTGADVLSDIGASASGHNHSGVYEPADAGLTSLAGLTYVAASFVKMTGANTFALRTLQETSDDLEATIDHDNLLNFTANEHFLQSAITQVGTIATGVWNGSDVPISSGGTGASTAANARTFLGLEIGTNVQAFGAILDDLNTLGAPASNGQFIVATGAGAFAYEAGTTARSSLGLSTSDEPNFNGLKLETEMFIREQAAADSDIANYGQIWVKSTSPNTLWFTNENGADVQLGLDENVKIDALATAGYLGAASNDGVLRASTGLSYVDGGNFVTLGLDINALDADASPDNAADYILTYDASTSAHKKVLFDNLPSADPDSACWAYLSTDQSLTSGVYNKLEFDSEDYDAGSEWDTTNYKFTAAAAGYYMVFFRAYVANLSNGKEINTRISKNGTPLEYGRMKNNTGIASSLNFMFTSLYYLAASDYLEFYIHHDEGAARDAVDGLTGTTARIFRLTK